MCARFTLTQTTQSVSEYFSGILFPLLEPQFNIAPTQPVLCLRHDNQNHDPQPVFFRWGLVPSWANDLSFGSRTINARCETIATKPAFTQAFQRRRCVVLADGFYEWQTRGKKKVPFRVSVSSGGDSSTTGPMLLMAGLWESWQDPQTPNRAAVETCTVITTVANEVVRPLHDRMPVLLRREDLEMWLDPEFCQTTKLQRLFKPCDGAGLEIKPANPWLNRVGNEGARCLESPLEIPEEPTQGTLF